MSARRDCAVCTRALNGEGFTQTDTFDGVAHDRRTCKMKINMLLDTNGQQTGAFQAVADMTLRMAQIARLTESGMH